MTIVDRVVEIAWEKGVKPSQFALAWLLAKGEDIVPIPGTTCRDHLEENVAALDIVLTPEDLSRIEAVIPLNAASGQRYNEAGMRNVNG